MSHSERIQEAAKEIHTRNNTPGKFPLMAGDIAAIISKHIPEQNELLTTALNRMIGRCSPSPSGRFRRLDQKLFSELYDIYTQAMHPAEWGKANALATPSEPLGVTKPLGVEPVPTISSTQGAIRPSSSSHEGEL